MEKALRDELISTYRDGLLDDSLGFWTKHAVDRECGGFLHYLDSDGTVLSTDKGIWVQARFTWLLSRLYNSLEPRQEWLELARHGMEFLQSCAFDTDGRCFYSVTRDGAPLRKRRYLYSEALVAMALAEYGKATEDPSLVDRAYEVFELILRYHRTPGLLEPKVNPQTRQAKSHGMPMMMLVLSQVLRDCDERPICRETIDDSIKEIFGNFVHEEKLALLETVGPGGQVLAGPEGRLVNPGHAIETAWFLMEEARRRGDAALIKNACRILDWALDAGWDKEFGGILYFIDVEGKPPEAYEHDMKLWWPHTEAIYATLLAYHLTGEERYQEWHRKVHEWAYSHFPDEEYGEWFGYLHRDGSLSSRVKGNMWKGPFHLPRMQLFSWKLLEEMLVEEPAGEADG